MKACGNKECKGLALKPGDFCGGSYCKLLGARMSEERAGKFPAVMFLGNWFLTDDFRVFTHMRFVFEETRVRADGTRNVSNVDRMLSEQLPGLRDAVYKAVSTVELEDHGDRPMVVHQGGVLRAYTPAKDWMGKGWAVGDAVPWTLA